MTNADFFINQAETFYKHGKIIEALDSAEIALCLLQNNVAIKLFMAKCHSTLGLANKSNEIYRSLIDEKNFIPPMLLGLLHNNLDTCEAEKLSRNIKLIKLYV